MFSKAIDYMGKYRQNRRDGLRNVAPLRWFCSEADKLSDVVAMFGSDDENSRHIQVTGPGGSHSIWAQVGIRMKIAFLAGCRHDLRGQFAVAAEDVPKTGNDFDRHAMAEADGAQFMTASLSALATSRAEAK